MPIPFPASLVAMHTLMQRYGSVRRQRGRSMQVPGMGGDPLWASYAAAESAAEVYERLLTWHLASPNAEQWVAFADPLRLMLGAVAGVLDGNATSTPVVVVVDIGRELLAPAPMAAALLETTIVLVVDAIQQGAVLITVTAPSATTPMILVQSTTCPPQELLDASERLLHHWGQLRVMAEPGCWSMQVDANLASLVERSITDTR